MRTAPNRRRPPTDPLRARVGLEPLEDRCVYSVTPFDLQSVTGVHAFVPLAEPSSTSAPPTSIVYTGPLLTVPTYLVGDWTTTVVIGDQPPIPASLIDGADDRTAVVSSPVLTVPGTLQLDVQFHSPTATDLIVRLQVTTGFTSSPNFGARVETNAVSLFGGITGNPAVPPPPVTPPPPPASVPPTVPPPGPTSPPPGYDGQVMNPQPPPAGNVTPPLPPPPTAPARSPSVQYAEFRAGQTQIVFTNTTSSVAESRPAVLTAEPTRGAPATTPVASLPQRQSGAGFDGGAPELRSPKALDLVAAREQQVPKIFEQVAFLGVAVNDIPPVENQPDVDEVLLRLAEMPTVEAEPLIELTVAPVEDNKSDPRWARSAYLVVAGLLGVGTGRYYFGRRDGSLRRMFFLSEGVPV